MLIEFFWEGDLWIFRDSKAEPEMPLGGILEGSREVRFFWGGPGGGWPQSPGGGWGNAGFPEPQWGLIFPLRPRCLHCQPALVAIARCWRAMGHRFGGPLGRAELWGAGGKSPERRDRREVIAELGDLQQPGGLSSTEREKPGEGIPSGPRNEGRREGL